MVTEISINYLAVAVSAVVQFIIGGLWYSPVLFAKPWIRLTGLREEDSKGKSPVVPMLIAFVCAFVTSYVLAHFVNYTQSVTFPDGMTTGFWIWLGFVATSYPNYAFEGRSKGLYLINAGNALVGLLVIGGILAVWR